MTLMTYLYAFAAIGVVVLYVFFGVNLIWAIGYLVILLIVGIMPKKITVEAIVAAILIGAGLFSASIGQSSVSTIVTAFLILAAGVPGIAVYLVTTTFFGGYSTVHIISILPASIGIILLILHIVRYILTRIIFVTFWIPILDLLPIIIDAIIIIVMAYLTFTNAAVIYPIIQSGVTNLVKLI
jgi:hypothetical protein